MTARLFDVDAPASGVLRLSPAGTSRRARVVTALALLMMLVISSSALAATSRLEIGSFGPDGTTGTAFSSINQLAFHQASDKLYGLDAGASTIDGFDVSTPGSYSPLGGGFPIAVAGPGGSPDVAVDNSGAASASDLYFLSESSGLYGFTAAGADRGGSFPVSGFGDPCGAAVDPSGNVWVGDYGTQSVKELSSAGASLGSVDTAAQGSPCHVAFDANGDLYAAMYFGAVWKYTAASGYATATEIDSGSAVGLTVDRASHDIYVVHADQVSVYDATGASLYRFAGSIAGASLGGVAVDQATDRVFVADAGNNVVRVFGAPMLVAGATTGAASDVTLSGATLHGSANAGGVALSDCHFEYGTDTSYGQSAPCVPAAGALPVDSAEHPVTAAITGLASDQGYHARLVVINGNGTLVGDDQTFTTPGAGILDSGTVAVDVDSATLAATINPNTQDTTYHFEYGTDTTYGHSTAESTSVGSDSTGHRVSRTVTGLTPDVTYHWRIVVTNAAGTVTGPDHAFTTRTPTPAPTTDTCPNTALRNGASAALPDCRAYEMVSPVDKNGSNILAVCNNNCQRAELVQSSLTGDKLTYSSAVAFGDQPSAPYSSQYLASRDAGGWTNHGINAPRDATNHQSFDGTDIDKQYYAFTSDLSTAWLENNNAHPLTPGGVLGENNLYRRDNLTDDYRAILSSENGATVLLGISADGRHTIVGSPSTPDASSNDRIDDNVDGVSYPISVLPDGSLANDPVVGTSTHYGARYAGPIDRGDFIIKHAVSDDGSRIFWSNPANIFSVGDLYVRIDDDRTVEVASPGNFITASTDGTKVLYESPADGGRNLDVGRDLYVFDVDSRTRHLIAHRQKGVLGTSDDLSYVYFDSQNVLAPGGVDGRENLYVDHDGSVSFIGDLTQQDVSSETSDVSQLPVFHIARVSPDGRHLVFESSESLTGYDNADAVTREPDIEVFVYDADRQRLTCVSCNPSGARPVGQARPKPYTANDEFYDYGAAAWLPTSKTSYYNSRPLSDDGSRVFFNSLEALVSRDTNGAQDVYEWEADGSGSCQQADGCVSLISSGLGAEKSEFVDADSRGENVFFFTSSSLVSQDTGLIDIYDARVGGGFPSLPAAPAACSGDGCRTAGPPLQGPSIGSGSAASGDGGPPSRGTLRVRALSAAQLRSLAAGQPVSVQATVNRAGRLRLLGRSRLGAHDATVLAATATVAKAGVVHLRLRLSAIGRRRLADRGKLVVSVSVTFSNAARPVRSTLHLVRPPGSSARKARATSAAPKASRTSTGSTQGAQS